MSYVGRFAPSPTGPLHAGSMAAALASWLDARAHQGNWLVRIEDVDQPRCLDGVAELQLAQLAACGLVSDRAVWWQSTRSASYQGALDRLSTAGHTYPCACSRRDIDEALAAWGTRHQRFAERIYPGTCRPDRGGLQGRAARVTRFLAAGRIDWVDHRLGPQSQDVEAAVGDFVLRRADGLWAYQLAVVVDDGEQAITHVVRGEDLADNTARQVLLQRALSLPTPSYLHTPLVCGVDGQKLSKQNGAQAIDTTRPVATLQAAAATLGLPPIHAATVADWLAAAVPAWAGIMQGFEDRFRSSP